MTALPEGELENCSNDSLIYDQPISSNIEHDPGSPQKDPIPGDPSLLKFLQQYDLLDMKELMVSSKLTLAHLQQVEMVDLDALCSDLNLSSSQKIRVKHAVKTLQNKHQSPLQSKLSNEKEEDAPTHIEIKESRNGRLKRRMFAKVEQIFGNDVGNEPEGLSKEKEKEIEQKNDQKKEEEVKRLRTKIVIVGEAAVGKTTLQKAIMGWQFEEGSKATFAVNSLRHKSRFKHNDISMEVDYEIFDTPGLDRFRDIISLYLRGALAVIVVYDVSKPSSFAKAKWWIEYLENHASGYDKIILIANKIDIEIDEDGNYNENEEDGKEEVEEDPGSLQNGVSTAGKSDECIITGGRMYATEHGIAFLEISAKTGDNINVLTAWINTQSKLKVDKNPQLLEKEKENIKLHEPLLGGRGSTERGLMDRLCCS